MPCYMVAAQRCVVYVAGLLAWQPVALCNRFGQLVRSASTSSRWISASQGVDPSRSTALGNQGRVGRPIAAGGRGAGGLAGCNA